MEGKGGIKIEWTKKGLEVIDTTDQRREIWRERKKEVSEKSPRLTFWGKKEKEAHREL